MKKIVTLLFAACIFISACAQTSKDETRRVILGQEKGNPSSGNNRDVVLGGNNKNHSGSHQAQIDEVNREYNSRVWAIRNNRALSQADKDRMIQQLEKDRTRRIRQINQNGNYSYVKNGKGNNGKHLGWEKGKGNPHQYEAKAKTKKKNDDRDDD